MNKNMMELILSPRSGNNTGRFVHASPGTDCVTKPLIMDAVTARNLSEPAPQIKKALRQ